MAVYVDNAFISAQIGNCRPALWSHLTADTLEELHAFARKIGLRPEWFQEHPRHPHYDVTKTVREKAITLGAVAIHWKTKKPLETA